MGGALREAAWLLAQLRRRATVSMTAAALGTVLLVATIGFLHVASGPAVFLSLIVIIGHLVR